MTTDRHISLKGIKQMKGMGNVQFDTQLPCILLIALPLAIVLFFTYITNK